MTLTWPWMLLAVPVIVAVAAWVLVRPGRRGVIVGSLSLWEQARDELRHAPRRRIRRVHLAWLLLLGGAIFAALAAAGPVSFAEKPSRRVAIELAPSAEFSSPAGRRAIRQAAEQLLGRLSPVDRAELLLPTVLGGRSDWLGPDQAAARIAELPSLPVRRGELSFPPPGEQAQHLYRFAPAGADLPAGPEASLVELPPSPPKITIDAFAAEPVDGDAELFVALRNHDDQPRTVSLQLQSFD
ncbi:MAG: BatA domain-containing protein, partial [Planctomycetota bacterium]